jgi:hypothetical protein
MGIGDRGLGIGEKPAACHLPYFHLFLIISHLQPGTGKEVKLLYEKLNFSPETFTADGRIVYGVMYCVWP